MQRLPIPTLVQYLRDQAHVFESLARQTAAMGRQSNESFAAETPRPRLPEPIGFASEGLRVPLAANGAIWSARVEEVADDHLSLVVDHEAIDSIGIGQTASIRFQPDNCDACVATGRIASQRTLPREEILLEFAMRA